MKGIIFTEFMDMVEDTFGLAMLDRIIEKASLPTDGAYSAVGTYDHAEMVRLIQALSAETNTPIPDLVRTYGEHLFGCYKRRYPDFFLRPKSCFEFLDSIEGVIHVEVRKLYPDAELPHFRCEILDGGRKMTMLYESSRPFTDLAHGLIIGCARYYGEDIALERKNMSADGVNRALFTLTKRT